MNINDLSASDHDLCFDGLMRKAYDAIVILLVNSQLDSERYPRWKQLVQHVGNHYVLPWGSNWA